MKKVNIYEENSFSDKGMKIAVNACDNGDGNTAFALFYECDIFA